jgi:photosystem II stability/assembly factor-like uncharacterized protein
MDIRMIRRGLLYVLVLASGASQAGINTWTLRGPAGGNTTAIAFHPTQPDLVLAQTWGGLYRSTDGGVTWSMPGTNAISAVGSVVFDPSQSGRVFLGSDTIYRSNDSGLNFTRLVSPSSRYVNDMAVASDGTLYMADQGIGVFRSDDHGAQWTEVTGPWTTAGSFSIHDLVVDPNDPNRIYVGVTTLGLFRSDDRGATWVTPANNSPGTGLGGETYIASIAIKPGDPDRILVGTGEGVYATADRGATWAWASFNPFDTITFVAFDSANPSNVVSATARGKVMRSTDSGATWLPNPTDLHVGFVNDGAFVPGTAGRLFLATIDGPMLSTDGGLTFTPRFSGIRAGGVSGFATANDGTLYSLYEYGPMGVFRRQGDSWLPLANAGLRSTIYTSPAPIDIATAATDPSLIYVIARGSLVVRSNDGGVSWAKVATELDINTSVQHVAVDPANPAIAYLTTYNFGLWKTTDRGATWNRCGLTLPDRVEAIGIDPADPRILYVAGYAADGKLLGLFKSLDGGATFAPTGATRPGMVLGFTFNPADTRDVYVYSGADVLHSTNGGDSWTQLDFGAPQGVYTRAMAFLVDPVIPSTMFVVSSPGQAGFLRSVDSGATWERFPFSIPQGEFLFLDEAVLDPLQPGRVHVGVTGLGIADYEVAPDLDVALLGFDAPLPVQGSRAVRVRVRNLSPFASSAYQVRVTLPGFLTGDGPANCAAAAHALYCNLGVIRALSSQDLEFTVTAGGTPATGDVSVEVEGHESDPAMANNQATVPTQSRWRTDLAVAVPASSSVVRTQTRAVDITVTNQGPDAAPAPKLSLQLAAGVSAISATVSVGTCAVTASTVNCELGTLATNAAGTVNLTLRGEAVGTAAIGVLATADGIDPDDDQAATAYVPVTPLADVAVELAAAAGSKVAGTPYSYTATVRNNGPDATGIHTGFTVAGATVSAATTPGGSCVVTSPTVACTLNSLASGANTSIVYTVSAAAAGNVSVDASAAIDGADSAPANNAATVAVSVASPPAPAGGGSGGGGGGGGRIDWVAAMLLGVLAAIRARRVLVAR